MMSRLWNPFEGIPFGLADLLLWQLELAVQVTLLVAGVALLAWLCRDASASVRRWVWSLAVASIAVLPVVSAILPGVSFVPELSLFSSAPTLEPTVSSPFLLPIQRDSSPPSVAGPTSTEATAAEHGASGTSTAAMQTSRPTGGPRLVPVLFLLGWALGAFFLACRAVARRARLHRLVHHASAVSEPGVRARFDAVLRAGGTGPRPRLLVSDEVSVPFAIGTGRPTVLLPRAALCWSGRRLDCVLRHELAHLRALDPLFQQLAEFATVWFWYHPLVHLARGRLEREREAACDDVVLRGGVRPSEYARELLAIASQLGADPAGSVAMAGGVPRLTSRVRGILSAHESRTAITQAGRWGLIAGVVMLTAVVASIGLAPRAGAEREAQATPVPAQAPETSALSGWLRALSDPSPSVRVQAAHELGDLKDSRARGGLETALRDEDARVRREAQWALREIREREVERVLQSSDPIEPAELPSDTRKLLAHELGDTESADRLDVVLVLLLDPSEPVRERAAWALGEIRDPRALDALLDRLRAADESRRVKRQCIRALGEIGSSAAVDRLVDLLSSEDGKLRSQAADALGDIGDPAARTALEQATEDENSSVRSNARKALGKIGGE